MNDMYGVYRWIEKKEWIDLRNGWWNWCDGCDEWWKAETIYCISSLPPILWLFQYFMWKRMPSPHAHNISQWLWWWVFWKWFGVVRVMFWIRLGMFWEGHFKTCLSVLGHIDLQLERQKHGHRLKTRYFHRVRPRNSLSVAMVFECFVREERLRGCSGRYFDDFVGDPEQQ